MVNKADLMDSISSSGRAMLSAAPPEPLLVAGEGVAAERDICDPVSSTDRPAALTWPTRRLIRKRSYSASSSSLSGSSLEAPTCADYPRSIGS